jgi:hypothetical protein
MKREWSVTNGFSLVEVILAGSIFMLFVSALIGALIYGQESTVLSGSRVQAVFLADESLEAVRNIRDEDFANLSDGSYGLQIVGGNWNLAGTSDTVGIFTRQINISTIDVNTKQITATITWQQNAQRQGTVSLTTYLTYWMALSGNQADDLDVDISGSGIDGGDNTKVIGINIDNIGLSDITIDQMTVSWTGALGGTKINDIYIDGASVWAGAKNSGATLDIADFTLVVGSGPYVMDFLDFSKNMTGVSITIDFIMLDGSSTSVTFVPGVATDTTAPAAISDLLAINPTSNSIDLTWTSPGDDGSTGTATSYDIRYSTSLITDANWASALQLAGEPSPAVAGSTESVTVSSLNPSTTYYFAIKTSDEVPNQSLLSNVPNNTTIATPSDTTPPSAVSDLAAINPATNSIDLTWTAPGDDGSTGTATFYDIRYSTSLISDANWASATQVASEPTPSVAGSSESMTVSGLSSGTTYYFAIKTSDEVPNESLISNVVNNTTTSSAEADNLVVDISGVAIDGGDNTNVVGITIENTGGSDITMVEMAITWTGAPGGTKINEIIIDGGSVWSGKSGSGSTLNITDFTLISGAGTYPINLLDFSKNMTGTTLSIDFIMSDASTLTVSSINP